jgi:energy-coupling factor transport system permease protein
VRPALSYRPRHTPLHDAGAAAASVYLGSLALVAFVYSNPIVLIAAGAGVVVAGVAAGAGRALLASARWGATLGIFIVAVNGLVAQRGDTILIHGLWLPLLGSTEVSAEAFVEGAVLALRIVVVLMAFAVHTACVDPDRTLRLLRPLARRSALTATVLARLVPLAAADHARLAEAATLRGPAATPVGRAALARRLVAGSLDRAIDVAATLELRGYARGAPGSARGVHRSRRDRLFWAAGLMIAIGGIAARVAGMGGFHSYPTVSVEGSWPTLLLAGCIPLLAALPFLPAVSFLRRGTRG